MKKNIIYGIIDSLSKEMRYVGKSTSGLKRPKSHFRKKSRQTHLSNFIKKAVNDGLTPEIIILESVNRVDDLNQAEVRWIKHFRELGSRLINQTSGGEGVPGFKHRQETLEKISQSNLGRKHSLESKAKIGLARLGRISPHSSETREKISTAMKNSWKKRKKP